MKDKGGAQSKIRVLFKGRKLLCRPALTYQCINLPNLNSHSFEIYTRSSQI